jgi:serine/threonine protein kinase
MIESPIVMPESESHAMQSKPPRHQPSEPRSEAVARADLADLSPSTLVGVLRGLELVRDAYASQAPPEFGGNARDEADDCSGPILFDRYEIIRPLGVGGFGTVFLALDRLLKRRVALKVPRPEVLLSEQLRARFIAESYAVAQFDHPGILPIYDCGHDDHEWYIAMPYCAGPSLAEWSMRIGGQIRPRLAALIVSGISDAAQYAHARGILHRDIKPSNILLMPLDCPADADFPFQSKLTDFGLSKTLETESGLSSGLAIGTQHYMAPEQWQGATAGIGTHTDTYALGVVLYELLTGAPPFADKHSVEHTLAVLQTSPPPIRSVRPDVPRDLETICRKCLEKTPADRYASVRELKLDLERFLGDEPIHAQPPGVIRRLSLWCKRRPVVAALLAVLVVTLAAGASGVLWQWREAQANLAEVDVQARLARQRLRQSESLLVRMSWALDESYFWNDSPYTFNTDFRKEIGRDLAALVDTRADDCLASLPALAVALRRQGHEAFERNEIAAGNRITRQSLHAWRRVLRNEPDNKMFRRSAALTLYYFAINGFSFGENAEQLLTLENERLVPGFSWRQPSDVQLAEDLALLLQARALAIEKILHLPSARAAHFASRTVWQQLAAHRPERADYQLQIAREHGAMGICDHGSGNHQRAVIHLRQSTDLLRRLRLDQKLSKEAQDLHAGHQTILEEAAKNVK